MRFIFVQNYGYVKDVKALFFDMDSKKCILKLNYDKIHNIWIGNTTKTVNRYKYILNDCVRINDYNAKMYEIDDKNEVWTVNKECQSDNVEKDIAISKHGIVSDNLKEYDLRANYSVFGNKKIFRYETILANVKGIHSETIMVHQPDGRLYSFEEIPIITSLNDYYEIETATKINLFKMEQSYLYGVWQIKVYIDGKYMLTDYMLINEEITKKMIIIDKTI